MTAVTNGSAPTYLEIEKQYLCDEDREAKEKQRGPKNKDMTSFPFNPLKSIVYKSYDPQADPWCIVDSGLNVRGECTNKVCAAVGKTVWVQHQLNKDGEKFNVAKLVLISKCPACLQTAKNITNLGFHNCKYKIEGMKEGSTVQITVEGQTQNNKFTTFATGKNVKWAWMEVTAKKI